jgi:hypothetical protein
MITIITHYYHYIITIITHYYHYYYYSLVSLLLLLRYDYCTRLRDPPPPEPEVNDMVRELFKQLKVFFSPQKFGATDIVLCIYCVYLWSALSNSKFFVFEKNNAWRLICVCVYMEFVGS